MKIFTILFTIIALGLILFNITVVDWKAPLEGDSVVALITIFAALCAIVLLQILRLSKRVEKQQNARK
jgi:uncharacterized membrane protein